MTQVICSFLMPKPTGTSFAACTDCHHSSPRSPGEHTASILTECSNIINVAEGDRSKFTGRCNVNSDVQPGMRRLTVSPQEPILLHPPDFRLQSSHVCTMHIDAQLAV